MKWRNTLDKYNLLYRSVLERITGRVQKGYSLNSLPQRKKFDKAESERTLASITIHPVKSKLTQQVFHCYSSRQI